MISSQIFIVANVSYEVSQELEGILLSTVRSLRFCPEYALNRITEGTSNK